MPATGKRRKTHKETAVVRSQGVQDNEAGLLTRIIFWLAKRRIGRVPLGLRVRARDLAIPNSCGMLCAWIFTPLPRAPFRCA
jgi:hypothetical protein